MIDQAVILAGGLGTRLRPITEKIPKPLVEVAGKPFLHWQLRFLRDQEIFNVLLLCGYLGEQIESEFGDGNALGLKIKYSFEPEPMGTGGALQYAKAQLHDQFFLLNGDSFLNINLAEIFNFFEGGNFDAVVSALMNLSVTPVTANLKIKNTGIVEKYKKNGGSGYNAVDSGVYILRKKILSGVSFQTFQLEDLWPQLMVQSKLGAFVFDEKFYDIGTLERIKIFEEHLRDHLSNSF